MVTSIDSRKIVISVPTAIVMNRTRNVAQTAAIDGAVMVSSTMANRAMMATTTMEMTAPLIVMSTREYCLPSDLCARVGSSPR